MLHTTHSYGRGTIRFLLRTGIVAALVAFCFASGVRAEKPVQRSVREHDAADGAIGPDIVMSGISDEENYGSVDGVSAFMFGQINCNRGDEWVAYFNTTNEHPIMTQNLYRLSQGRFEQLGESWVYHEFYATDSNYCGHCSDTDNSVPGTRLAVGCSTYNPGLILGIWAYVSPRSEVNAATGEHPGFPMIDSDEWANLPRTARRLKVRNDDIDPALNTDALYFVEGQVLAADDAAAGNNDNNVSYKPVVFSSTEDPEVFFAHLVDSTIAEQPAIRAWQDHDPSVVETDVHIPGDGWVILAANATPLDKGWWHYEYAIENVNSDRSIQSVAIPLRPGTNVANVGFRGVEHYGEEPYDETDWSVDVTRSWISWSTLDYADYPDANALRWGSLYNFSFDADSGPGPRRALLGVFKPVGPKEMPVQTTAPIGQNTRRPNQ